MVRDTKSLMLDSTGRRIADGLKNLSMAMAMNDSRITALAEEELASGMIIEVIGIPTYVSDVSGYSEYGITETGWYAFCRIAAKGNATVTEDTTVTGAAGYIATEGADHIDLAVRFEVAAMSKPVTIDWVSYEETYIFKATDLAVRNLDYRTTFYVYDAAPFAIWSYTPATDATFVADKAYFILNDGEYTPAEVTAGETVPTVYYEQVISYELTADTAFADGKTYYTESDGTYTAATVTTGDPVTADTYYEQVINYVITEDATFQDGKTYYTLASNTYSAATVTAGATVPTVYYVHSKVRFEGLTRNVTYRLDEPVDCPSEFVLPVVSDDDHGCWFEIRLRHTGSFSSTLIPSDPDAKVASEHTQAETAGINMINLHYTNAGGVKLWRFMNTHSSIPTA